MIPMVIIYLVKKLGLNTILIAQIYTIKRLGSWIIFILIMMLFTRANANGLVPLDDRNENKIEFRIVRNDRDIGAIMINQSATGDSIIYSINCDVKVNFIFSFEVVGKEKYIYKNGTLIYSSLYRTLNNSVKANHSILYNDGEYTLHTNEKISSLNIKDAIKYNLMVLYVNEPIGIDYVFCDNQQQMVKVKPIATSIYKVELSKGKYNIFHYDNGRCIKVEAVSPLFKVNLIPVSA